MDTIGRDGQCRFRPPLPGTARSRARQAGGHAHGGGGRSRRGPRRDSRRRARSRWAGLSGDTRARGRADRIRPAVLSQTLVEHYPERLPGARSRSMLRSPECGPGTQRSGLRGGARRGGRSRHAGHGRARRRAAVGRCGIGSEGALARRTDARDLGPAGRVMAPASARGRRVDAGGAGRPRRTECPCDQQPRT